MSDVCGNFFLFAVLISILLPFGVFILVGIVFTITILNYHKTSEIHSGMNDIRKHLGLLKAHEIEEYEIEEQLEQVDTLDSDELDEINKEIEKELEVIIDEEEQRNNKKK